MRFAFGSDGTGSRSPVDRLRGTAVIRRPRVALLRDLASQVQVGQSVGELIAHYREGVPDRLVSRGDRSPGQLSAMILLELLEAGDTPGADAVLDRFQEKMSPLELIEDLIEPVLVEIGERAFRRESRLFQVSMASVCLIRRLHRLLDAARRTNLTPRRRILVGTVEGDRHEGGDLMVSLALELAGWRTIALGSNLPVDEIAGAVDAWNPDALALSFVLSRNLKKRFGELSQICSIPVFVGGRSIVNHQSLARRLGLNPLVGPLSAAVSQLILDAERWFLDRARVRNVGTPRR